MVGFRFLLVGILAVMPQAAHYAPSAGISTCSQFQISIGQCQVHGSIGNGSVNIGGNATTPGAPSSPPEGNGLVTDPVDTSVTPGPGDPGFIFRDPFGVINPVTINDLKSFHPSSGADSTQPVGWTIVGLPTNFYSAVGPQVLRGRLLHHSVAVRFTPVGWHWSYGDGTTATLTTPGATWAALRVAEFDPTPTSHSYTVRGDYTAQLGIEFAAEYRFAGGEWTTVSGTLLVPASPLRITAESANTVLVGDDCSANPSGPGC